MYKTLLEERFGEDQVDHIFSENSIIDTLEFRTMGPGGWKFNPIAQFTNSDTVGYVRAMIKTVDNLIEVFSRVYKEKIDIGLARGGPPDEDSETAFVFLGSKSDEMCERLYCAIYGAAKAIREYGERLRYSF